MTWTETPGYECKGPSETVQGDVLPLSKILLRYANGMDVPNGGAVFGDVEDDEHETEDLAKAREWDLVDKDFARKNHQEFIVEIQDRIKKKTQEKEKQAENGSETP